jgi:hypothetical protein
VVLPFSFSKLLTQLYSICGRNIKWNHCWTHWKKKKIDQNKWKKENENDPGSQIIHVYAVCYEPKLAEEIEARSSRDRVARVSLVAFFRWYFGLQRHGRFI